MREREGERERERGGAEVPIFKALTPPPRLINLVIHQTMPYRLDESTGLIDYDTMEKTVGG
jgi:hypothetical protein